MIEEILKLDTELFLFLNSLGSPVFDNIWIYLSYKEANILFYSILLIFYSYYKSFKLSEVLYLLLIVAIMITITDQTANLFKDSFQRLRPCYDEVIKDSVRIVKEGCGGKYGFFSAHASNSFSLAIFFGLLFRDKYKYIISFTVLYASLISYSRIYLGVHFPLDLLFGSLFGIIIGFIIFIFYDKQLNFFKFFNKS